MQKNIIVVLGPPRSGTSAITRGLKALGIEIGNDLTPADSLWNPKGFWEDKDISNKINCRILATLHSPWESLTLIDEKKLMTETVSLQKLAAELLQQKMQNYSYWGFKDPRTAKLLPFWQQVFKNLQLKEYYIIVLRNPLAMALSYQKLRSFDLETALILWLMHMIPAIDETQQKNRMIISFEQMLKDPHLELKKIQDKLQLNHSNPQELSFYMNQFLDKSSCHYSVDLADLKSHPVAQTIPLCVEIYELLLKTNINSEEFRADWQKIKEKFAIHYPMYVYLDNLLKENKKITKELRSVRRSVSWNLIYPVRMIENKIKNFMREKRLKRRLTKGSF